MITLYLDKFRGFRNTTVRLSRVNFLVGENSTGKSSVLGLIHLLTSPDFWFTGNFNLPEHEFGGFLDILSAGCDRQDRFTIGAAGVRINRDTQGKTQYAYILSYDERDSLPRLVLFARLEDDKLMSVRLHNDQFVVRKETLTTKPMPHASRAFEILTAEAGKPIQEFSELPEALKTIKRGVSMMHLLSLTGFRDIEEEREIPFKIPFLGQEIAWFAPIRTRPKRTYDGYEKYYSPEGEHTPYVIRRKLSSKSIAKAFRKALTRFGLESGLFSDVRVHSLGKDAAAPFELIIRLQKGCDLRINSVGYGVSQALPLVVEMLLRRPDCWFLMQQPEVHLHPRAQAALGDVIYAMAERERKQFIIETHSDFTIDRFRMNLRNSGHEKSDAQVLFFARTTDGNHVFPIPIGRNGEYPHEQPDGFRNFFLKEQMDLLGI